MGVGPLRLWPGGLCLSRAIGDFDVGDSVLSLPYISQVHIAHPPLGTQSPLLLTFTCWQQLCCLHLETCNRAVCHQISAMCMQVRVPPEGARLLVASDGVWDAFMKTARVASIARSAATQVGLPLVHHTKTLHNFHACLMPHQ